MDLFGSFAIFIERPELALLPALAFAAFALRLKHRILWIAVAAWTIYAAYEAGNRSGLLCSGECNIRADLLFLVPILAFVSVIGLAAAVREIVRGARQV